MTNKLVQFDIKGLHGIRDYSIRLDDNRVIIVGENGSGKTTVFKIMYYAISCDWDLLRTFDFEKVIMLFSNNQKVCIELELLKSIYEINDVDRVAFYVDGHQYGRNRQFPGLINSLIEMKKRVENKNEEEFDRQFSASSAYPYRYIKGIFDARPLKDLYTLTKKIEQNFDATILYLPTYRRIEEQLKNIFPNMDSDDWNKARKKTQNNRAIELVEFGMDDVESAVKAFQEHLNDFSRAQQNKLTLGYLSEIIEQKYEQVNIEDIRKLTEEQVGDILKRIERSILSDEQKSEITRILVQKRDANDPSFQVREKIICHYFLKLIDFDRDMSKEEAALLKFIEKCNKYLVSNRLVYDKQNFICKIYNKVDEKFDSSNEIHFQDMSSGEKQIVSLFSHLNLSKHKGLFVFIDEPELSLSVDWQRTFLVDILDSISCMGLVATTHSPFVFENELERYVHGINEFCTRG